MPARDGERSGSTEVEGTVRSGKVGSERRYLSLIEHVLYWSEGEWLRHLQALWWMALPSIASLQSYSTGQVRYNTSQTSHQSDSPCSCSWIEDGTFFACRPA